MYNTVIVIVIIIIMLINIIILTIIVTTTMKNKLVVADITSTTDKIAIVNIFIIVKFIKVLKSVMWKFFNTEYME